MKLYLLVILFCLDCSTAVSIENQNLLRIVNEAEKALYDKCCVMSTPNGFHIGIELRDIKYFKAFYSKISMCKPFKPFPNNSAIITTDIAGCTLMEQINNARSGNVAMLVLVTDNYKSVQYSHELDKYPAVVLMSRTDFEQIKKSNDFTNVLKIGVHGNIGSNVVGYSLTLLLNNGVVIACIIGITLTAVFFYDQIIHAYDSTSYDSKYNKWVVLVVPIVMIGMLLLVYFFYNVMVWISIISFFLLFAMCFSNLIMFIFYKYGWLNGLVYPFGRCSFQNVDVRAITLWAVGILISIVWIINRNNNIGLIFNNIMGIFVCVEISLMFSLMFYGSKMFRILLCLMGIVLVVDAVMVFTPFAKKASDPTELTLHSQQSIYKRIRREAGESIMEKVVLGTAGNSSEELPIRFKFPVFDMPRNRARVTCLDYSKAYSIIGYGDVIFPGIFVGFIILYAVATNSSVIQYSVAATLGYAVGIVLAFVVIHITKRGQPALIYLIPSTVLSTLIVIVIRRELTILWNAEWTIVRPQIIQEQEGVSTLTPIVDNGGTDKL